MAPSYWLRASLRSAVRKPSALRFDWIAVEELCVALSVSPYPFQVPISLMLWAKAYYPPGPTLLTTAPPQLGRIRAKALNNY